MSPSPSVGQWVWGDRMNPCQVVDIGTKRSTGQTMLKVLCPQGSKVIPLDKVRGCSDTPLVGVGPSPPNPCPIGSIVHKNPQVGWTGIVLKHIGTDSVEVLWVLDKHPTLMAVSGLRMADKAVTESSLKAFTKLGGDSMTDLKIKEIK